jgi:hypothetical protein
MASTGSTEDSKTRLFDRQQYSSLTKHDLCDLLEIVNRCLNIKAHTELKGLLLHIKNIIPCANIIAVLGGMDPSGRFQDLIKIINASYPVDWATPFMECGYGAVDPMNWLLLSEPP